MSLLRVARGACAVHGARARQLFSISEAGELSARAASSRMQMTAADTPVGKLCAVKTRD